MRKGSTMKVNSPCFHCEDRTMNCHSTCEQYKKFKAEMNKRNEELYEKNRKEKAAMEYHLDSIRRAKQLYTKGGKDLKGG